MTAYSIARRFHSYWRWAVLLLAAVALYRSLRGRPWSSADERISKWFIVALDLQVLIGLLLYFVWSPFSQAVFHDFKASMKVPEVRFFGLEHGTAMLLALVAAHIGRVRVRRAEPARKHRIMLITLLVWLALAAAAFPWPFAAYARPLLRLSW